MPPQRSTPGKTVKVNERSHEENQERAYIAASRRSDRSLQARMESARRASEVHKERTGRALRVTEEDVINEEMYEEEEDDLQMQYQRLTAHLNASTMEFRRRLGDYVTDQVSRRTADELNALAQSGQLVGHPGFPPPPAQYGPPPFSEPLPMESSQVMGQRFMAQPPAPQIPFFVPGHEPSYQVPPYQGPTSHPQQYLPPHPQRTVTMPSYPTGQLNEMQAGSPRAEIESRSSSAPVIPADQRFVAQTRAAVMTPPPMNPAAYQQVSRTNSRSPEGRPDMGHSQATMGTRMMMYPPIGFTDPLDGLMAPSSTQSLVFNQPNQAQYQAQRNPSTLTNTGHGQFVNNIVTSPETLSESPTNPTPPSENTPNSTQQDLAQSMTEPTVDTEVVERDDSWEADFLNEEYNLNQWGGLTDPS